MAAVTGRPIIFSAPMVRALLDGRKTQTRRIVRTPRWAAEIDEIGDDGYTLWCVSRESGCIVPALPQYLTHDRLWVREAFRVDEGGAIYDAAGGVMDSFEPSITYQADCSCAPGRWRPSIHMPRWVSRLTLTVTNVRVQRLQEISEADALAEGATDQDVGGARGVFSRIWNSLHGPDAWAANPWIVALTFTVSRCNINQMEAAQ